MQLKQYPISSTWINVGSSERRFTEFSSMKQQRLHIKHIGQVALATGVYRKKYDSTQNSFFINLDRREGDILNVKNH